jgi:predicted choloylglycine hydrolase
LKSPAKRLLLFSALRACFNSSAIEEAVETLHGFPRAASANYLIVDDKGRAADVEVDAGRAALVTWVSSQGAKSWGEAVG